MARNVYLTIRIVKYDPRMPVRPYGGVSAEQRVADRRARLLAAGLECFGTDGYGATGVKDLCREAGLTDRYFYESFRDSRTLFLAVFDTVTEELFTEVANAVIAVEPVAEVQLRAAIGTFLRALADDPRRARVVFGEPAAAGPEAAAHMHATLRRFTDLVEATARAHLPDATPESLSRVIALSLVGTLERVVVEWQAGAFDLGVDALTEHCVALYATLLAAR
jgi:AcrR family transcriptional regulator